jgi:hypothetical protein
MPFYLFLVPFVVNRLLVAADQPRYEYFDSNPLIVTMYFPYASRYYQGGGSYADQILS